MKEFLPKSAAKMADCLMADDDAPCGVDMLLHFTPTCLTVQARKSSDPATNAYEGVASGYVEGDADAP